MVGSKIQPHLFLQLAGGSVICVYDQDHLTSSAVSPCSGKPPVLNTVLTQKHIQYVRETMEDVYLKASGPARACLWILYILHTHAWLRVWLRHSRDWLRWCLRFNERSLTLVGATWALFTAWTEPGSETGNQAPESGYTRSPLAFIMPHYDVHSPPIIHTAMILLIRCRWMSVCWGCLHGGEGLQRFDVRGKCPNVPRTWLHFAGTTFCRIIVKPCGFPALQVMKQNLQAALLSGSLKYLKPKTTRTILRRPSVWTVLRFSECLREKSLPGQPILD